MTDEVEALDAVKEYHEEFVQYCNQVSSLYGKHGWSGGEKNYLSGLIGEPNSQKSAWRVIIDKSSGK